jgi:putative metallohydrolase (TIGR04338 family)
MVRMRDFQQSAVYATEQLLGELFDRTLKSNNPIVELEVDGVKVPVTLPPEAKFASIESIQRHCDDVCDMLKVSRVHVRARRGDRMAHYERPGAVIAVPNGRHRWALRELVVLHELAHHLTPSFGVASHGPEFVANFIDLIGRVMGLHAQLAARILFATNGVKETTKEGNLMYDMPREHSRANRMAQRFIQELS